MSNKLAVFLTIASLFLGSVIFMVTVALLWGPRLAARLSFGVTGFVRELRKSSATQKAVRIVLDRPQEKHYRTVPVDSFLGQLR